MRLLSHARVPLLSGTTNLCFCFSLFYTLNYDHPVGGVLKPHHDYDPDAWGMGIDEFYSPTGYANMRTQLMWTFLSFAVFFQFIVVNESVWSVDDTQGVFFLIVVNSTIGSVTRAHLTPDSLYPLLHG